MAADKYIRPSTLRIKRPRGSAVPVNPRPVPTWQSPQWPTEAEEKKAARAERRATEARGF